MGAGLRRGAYVAVIAAASLVSAAAAADLLSGSPPAPQDAAELDADPGRPQVPITAFSDAAGYGTGQMLSADPGLAPEWSYFKEAAGSLTIADEDYVLPPESAELIELYERLDAEYEAALTEMGLAPPELGEAQRAELLPRAAELNARYAALLPDDAYWEPVERTPEIEVLDAEYDALRAEFGFVVPAVTDAQAAEIEARLEPIRARIAELEDELGRMHWREDITDEEIAEIRSINEQIDALYDEYGFVPPEPTTQQDVELRARMAIMKLESELLHSQLGSLSARQLHVYEAVVPYDPPELDEAQTAEFERRLDALYERLHEIWGYDPEPIPVEDAPS